MHRLALALVVLAACFQAGCSTGTKKLTSTALGIASAFPQTRKAAYKARDYISIAEKLKKFHDSGELNQDDVLAVLKVGGVIKDAPGVPGVKPGTRQRVEKGVSHVPPPVESYNGEYRWPLDGGVVSSEYGHRWGKDHKGIDLAAARGDSVRASANGVVLYAGSGLSGYGKVVILRHDERYTTLYAHNDALSVAQGAKVTQGQLIAKLGSTGRSTGPHVHFEVRDGEQALDPRQKLVKSSF